MPSGTRYLKVKLQLLETGDISHDDLNGIQDRLGKLFEETSGWRSSMTVVDDSEKHEIIFSHRSLRHPVASDQEYFAKVADCSSKICTLVHKLCDLKSPISLRAVSKNIKAIRYMPYTSDQSTDQLQSNFQKLFNRTFVLAIAKDKAKASFEDMDAATASLLGTNPQKWLLGPLQAGVFLSDFLELFDNLAELLPIENIIQSTESSKAEILLEVLRYGAKYAPALRTGCEVAIGALDKNAIKADLVKADAAVRAAIDEAYKELKWLSTDDLLDGDQLDGAIEMTGNKLTQAIEMTGNKLTQAIEALQETLSIAKNEADRNSGNLFWCLAGGAVLMVTGSGVAVLGPAVGGILAAETFVGGMLGAEVAGLSVFSSGFSLAAVGGYVNHNKHVDINGYMKKLDDIRMRSIDIYSFLALAVLRRTGQMDDNDEKFAKFVLKMAATFEGTDVQGDWSNARYLRERVEKESKRLIAHFEDLRTPSAISSLSIEEKVC
ncbi:hypothetical protein TWF696_002427 [Orbilia brochopaga]|uniref:Uncharacterized protein n=1 Tax=Orbilia brochopaga TaxID=3140254 RepID=A0AAV9U4Q9_9PEZI